MSWEREIACTPCMVRSQLRLFAVAALLRVAASYSCTVSQQCTNRINGPLTGTKADVQAACDADVNCVAFDYDAAHSESASHFPHHSYL